MLVFLTYSLGWIEIYSFHDWDCEECQFELLSIIGEKKKPPAFKNSRKWTTFRRRGSSSTVAATSRDWTPTQSNQHWRSIYRLKSNALNGLPRKRLTFQVDVTRRRTSRENSVTKKHRRSLAVFSYDLFGLLRGVYLFFLSPSSPSSSFSHFFINFGKSKWFWIVAKKKRKERDKPTPNTTSAQLKNDRRTLSVRLVSQRDTQPSYLSSLNDTLWIYSSTRAEDRHLWVGICDCALLPSLRRGSERLRLIWLAYVHTHTLLVGVAAAVFQRFFAEGEKEEEAVMATVLCQLGAFKSTFSKRGENVSEERLLRDDNPPQFGIIRS